MAVNAKKMGLYGAVGFLVAALIIGGIAAVGFKIPSLKLPSIVADKGRLIIQVMDKPVNLTNLYLTIGSLSIQNGEGGWTDLELLKNLEQPFDLLALQNVAMTISDTEISAGTYTMIKMHVLTANATYVDGKTEELRVPSEHIKVLLIPEMEIESEGQITVTIDLEPEWSKIAISHSLNLNPVLKAMVGS